MFLNLRNRTIDSQSMFYTHTIQANAELEEVKAELQSCANPVSTYMATRKLSELESEVHLSELEMSRQRMKMDAL